MIAVAHVPIALLALLVAALGLVASPSVARRGTGLTLLGVGGIVFAGLFVTGDLSRALAVSATAFLLASGLPRATEAAVVASRRTLTWLAIAGSALLLSIALDDLNASQAMPGLAGPIGGLFVVGVAILLGAFPFGFWLSSLAEESPGFSGVLVGLLGLGATLLGGGMLTDSAWRVGGLASGPLLAVFGLAGVCATVLANGEKQPARVFAYLIGADGALQVGGLVAAPSATSFAPAVFALSGHALAAAVGLAVLAHSHPRLVGLYRQRPILAIALLVSASSLVGLPPTAGFAGHLVLNRLGAGATLLYPAFVMMVGVLGTLAIVRSFGAVFQTTEETVEPRSAVDHLAGLATALLILAGLAPSLFLATIH